MDSPWVWKIVRVGKLSSKGGKELLCAVLDPPRLGIPVAAYSVLGVAAVEHLNACRCVLLVRQHVPVVLLPDVGLQFRIPNSVFHVHLGMLNLDLGTQTLNILLASKKTNAHRSVPPTSFAPGLHT